MLILSRRAEQRIRIGDDIEIVVLAIDRPSSLAGMEEAQLLDPGYTSDGDWADGPLLGLGFSLRLIRSLAGACGGSLDVEPGRLLLAIPAASLAEDTQHA